MRVNILCPNAGCGASYSVEDRRLGREARCQRCGRRFALVPETQVNGSSTVPFANGLPPTESQVSNDLPSRFDRYRVIRLIGRGGMGAVYLAEDNQLERQVALKVPYLAPGSGPEVRERFLREARAAARFRHPNFCPIHDIGEVAGVPYLTMAFLEGRTLASMIHHGQPWPQRRAAEFARQLAVALAEAHRQGIVHRDLKPANVMVEDRGGLVLMDFGLARRFDAGDPAYTASGVILGTPAYMPPEQAEGNQQAVGPRSDLYSLGVILYELLTGRRPFEGSTAKVLGQIACNDPPPPSTFRSEIDPRLESICLKAIARRPDDRHPSMDELAREIEGWLRSVADAPSGPADPATVADTPEVPWKAKAPPDRRPRGFRLSVHAWGFKLTLAIVGSVMLLASGLLVVKSNRRVLDSIQAGSPTPKLTRNDPPPPPPPPGPAPTLPTVVVELKTDPPNIPIDTSRAGTALRGPARAINPLRGKVLSTISPPKITNSVGMELRLIPAGEFTMGSPETDDMAKGDERPQVVLRLPAFYLSAREVTQAEYRAMTGGEPSFHPGKPENPVEQVSWTEAVAYCNVLSEREGLTPAYNSKPELAGLPRGNGYRLPSEAEWEYACRAGSPRRYSFGGDPSELARHAWYRENSSDRPHLVGRLQPNPFGLFDMHGNVREWCIDAFAPSPGAVAVSTLEGLPPLQVVKGGSWASEPDRLRSAARSAVPRALQDKTIGFRVARDAH